MESTIHWERKLYFEAAKLNSKEYYINEINRLKEEKKIGRARAKKTQAELYRAHLEKDVYEKAAEILKEMGDNLKEFSNQERPW